MNDLIEHSSNRPIHLWNVNCPYCGEEITPASPSNKEHAVGKKFVPVGSLDRQWNLFLRVHVKCNNEKSQLEDDISVISMLPCHVSRGEEIEHVLAKEVDRRALKAGSRRTGKSVASSQENLSVKRSLGPATFTFNFIAPPQVDHQRLFRLAQLHFDAFFFYATYNNETKRGGFFPGGHHNVGYFGRRNWGASKARWFMELTVDWPLMIWAATAQSYFKLIIRRSPTHRVWACAVEWNHTIRVMRLQGDADQIRALLDTLPEHEVPRMKDGEGNFVRIVEEQHLPSEEDSLFSVPDLCASDPAS